MQCDFILSVNREDVLQDVSWNNTLVQTAQELFVQSVQDFHAKNIMRYTWPKYLTSLGTASHTIFHDFHSRTLEILRSTAVIESEASTMENPSRLKYVPLIFTDQATPPTPLLYGRGGMQDYASHKYSSTDLSKLGIRELSSTDFVWLLQDYLNTDFHRFCQQPAAWHSKLARALVAVWRTDLRDLRLIPLRDGSWVAASSVGKVFFPDMTDGLTFPIGIQVHVIDDAAAMESSRNALYSKLGAERLTSAEVYCLIRDQHRSHGSDFSGWEVESVVAHAWFLFTCPHQPVDHDLRRIRVASEDASRLHVGNELYMNNPEGGFNIREYLGADNRVVQYIHERYLSRADKVREKDWLRWLQTRLGVRTLPRLWSSGVLSPEFEWIIHSRSANDWLYLLKDQWIHYSEEIPHVGSQRDILAKIEVLCTDERKRPLRDVYLPTSEILTEPFCEQYVPLIAVDNAEHIGWKQFSRLGLRLAPDLRFSLGILEGMQSGSIPNVRSEDIQRIYERINTHFVEDPHFVRYVSFCFALNISGTDCNQRAFFANRASIYIARPLPGKWVNMAECRWASSSCLRRHWQLGNRYTDLHELFVQKLGIKNASGQDLVHELTALSGNIDQVDTIKQLLLTLGRFVEREGNQVNILSPLIRSDLKILPVDFHGSDLRSCVDVDWFFTTRERLKRLLNGKVALLDFSRDETSRLSTLLEKLGLERQSLLHNLIEETETDGQSQYHEVLTNSLRAKACYMSRLVLSLPNFDPSF